MPLEDRDSAHLWDMLQAANEVTEMIAGRDLDDFLGDRILRRAIERCIELVGEAARRVSDQGRAATPTIPWREIIGQRNILAHEYGQVDHELLYKTAVEDIPRLVETLNDLLPPV